LPSALSERFGVGANYTHYGKDWNLRIGVFGDDHYKFGSSVNYGKAITGRIGKKYKVFGGRMYMGLSLQYREPDEIIKVRTLPESHTVNIRLLDTDEIAFVNNIEKAGIEALWKNNNWTFQTEYIQNKIKREFGPDLNYNGGYLIASRIFNGQRRFSFRKGEWASSKVRNFKTWELSARYSYLDLQTSELKSGYQRNLSIGVNYYLSKLNRIMFNYINAKALPNSSAINENINIYQVRFQFEF
jgi:phosphate-selective porin OprO/OprP